jgi:hypothetical protein
MDRHRRENVCCTTSSSMCYWAAVFMLLYGAALVAKVFWPVLRLTGPLFLIASLAFLLVDTGAAQVNPAAIWGVLLTGRGVGVPVGAAGRRICGPS